MLRLIKFALLLAAAALGAAFAALNTEAVSLNYYLGKVSLPLGLLMLLALSFGLVCGALLSGWGMLKARFEAARLRKKSELDSHGQHMIAER